MVNTMAMHDYTRGPYAYLLVKKYKKIPKENFLNKFLKRKGGKMCFNRGASIKRASGGNSNYKSN